MIGKRRNVSNHLEEGPLTSRPRPADDAFHPLQAKEASKSGGIFDNMIEGFALCEIICDERGKPRDFRYINVNPSFERIIGLKQKDVVGKTAKELFPGIEPMWLEVYAKVALGGIATRFESWFEPRKIHLEVSAYCPTKGQFAAVFIDVTERKMVETALLRSEERHRVLVENIHDLVCELDGEGRYLFLSPNYTAMMGYEPADLLGRNAFELMHSDDVPPMTEKFLQPSATGTYRYLHKNGSWCWMESSAQTFSETSGGERRSVVVSRDITERRKGEERLRQLSGAVEHSPASVVITDTTGNIEYVNPKFTQVTGYTLEEAVGRNPRILKSGELPREFYQGLWKTIKSGHEWHGEFQNRKKNGERYWELASISPIIDEHGAITHFVAVKEDITAQKEMIETLRRSEAQFRTICEASPLGIIMTDRNADFAYANESFCKLAGVTFSELSGKGWKDIIHPEDRASVTTDWEQIKYTGQAFRRVRRYVRPGGDTIWVAVTVAPIHDKEIVRGYMGIVEDITDHYGVMMSLQKSEARFRQLAENVPGVFWMATQDSKSILYVSPAYEKIWGRSCQSLLNEPLSWLEAVHHADRERVREVCNARRNDGTYDEVYRIVRPDGSIRWIRDRSFKIREGDDKADRIAGIAEDITERKQTDDQLLRSQRMECIGTLAGGVAHDLNNILAPIMLSTELLREGAEGEMREDMIRTIEECASRGADIVSQVLTFARGVTGDRTVLQLRHLVRELEKIMRETFPRWITIVNRMPRDLWPVTGDATQLHQVLLNLCINARDAMPHEGSLIISGENVELGANARDISPDASPGPYAILEVTDTGMGIPEDIIGKIFDPFFTTKEVGKGTGLGLSTLIGIVKSHGGFVCVSSKTGEGTTFKVYLPASVGADASAGLQEQPAVPKGNGETILIVEDETAIRNVTKDVLTRNGYKVLSVSNGTDGVSAYATRGGEIDVVLTDVMMPMLDGVELTRALKKMNPEVKVIVCTGQATEVRQAELRDLGVHVFLQKPYSSEKLLTTLHEVLHEKGEADG